jgi:RimJ/RimL family protein N-acetyltransferase
VSSITSIQAVGRKEVITGARDLSREVLLRDVQDEDLPIFFEHQLDQDASEMAAFPSRDRDAHMEHWRTKILADETVGKKTIVVDGDVAGNVVSWVQEGERAIGYWVGKAHWGKGVATEAVRKFLVHESERPLYAHVATHNVGSIRVLQKCGFIIRSRARVSLPDGAEVEEFLMELR